MAVAACGLIAMAIFPEATAAAPVIATISLPGAELQFPLPDGYCLPQGQYDAIAKVTAAADTTNATDLSYDSCAEMKAGQDLAHFGMVKTPKEALLQSYSLPELVASFKAALGSGELRKALEDPKMLDSAKTDLKSVLGKDPTVSATIQPVDVDENGAYLAGTVTVSVDGKADVSAIAAGITVVKTKLVMCYFYAPFHSLADVADVLKAAKAETALFIRQNGS